MSDTTYDAQASYLRTASSPAEPPPVLAQGPIAWTRKNLFSSPISALLTILAVAFLAWTIPGLVRFLITDAVWSGNSAELCRPIRTGPAGPSSD